MIECRCNESLPLTDMRDINGWVEKVIKTLKKYGMGDCITVKESVNKDILKTYDEKTILSVGGKAGEGIRHG